MHATNLEALGVAPMKLKTLDIANRLDALARDVRLISLALTGIIELNDNEDDLFPLNEKVCKVESALQELLEEVYPLPRSPQPYVAISAFVAG
jgi:hypothetical protein